MAEAKKETKKTVKKFDVSKLSLNEAKLELQKIRLKVLTGEETNTSKIKKIKKHIARLLTTQSNK